MSQSILTYKTPSMDTVASIVIDRWVSALPTCVEGTVTVETFVKNKSVPHVQSLSDTVWCHVLGSLLKGYDVSTDSAPIVLPRNALDRFVQVVTDKVYLSAILPTLEEYHVIHQVAEGWTLHPTIIAFAKQTFLDLGAKAPMVNTPMLKVEDWTAIDSGIHTDSRMSLVSKSRGTKVSDGALNAVNKLQRVKMVIQPSIAAVTNEYIALIQQERMIVHTRFKSQVKATEETERLDGIIKHAKIVAALAAQPKSFSFGITMDWRGRMYYRSSTIQPQGTNFEKAALIFANSMPMSDLALEGLRVGVANELGKDKLSWNDRVQYMRSEGWRIALEVATTPTIATISKYVPRDKCFLALSGCVEYVRVIKEFMASGSWDGITSNYVIHQDGTCNGIQHAAALLQDGTTAFAVNCTASSKASAPQDIYGMVADTAAHNLTHRPELAAMLTRQVCKKPVMVTGYGASEGTVDEAIMGELPMLNAEDLELVCHAVHAAIEVHAAAVVAMTKALNMQITSYLEEQGGSFITWRTPDGMIIKQKYMDDANKVIMPSGFSVSLTSRKPLVKVDIKKMARALSPNFIHSLDANHLRDVVNTCQHELITIHDSIGSHAATFAATNKIIRETFVELHQSNPLRTLSAWNGNITLPITGDYDVSEVMNSTYLFS